MLRILIELWITPNVDFKMFGLMVRIPAPREIRPYLDGRSVFDAYAEREKVTRKPPDPRELRGAPPKMPAFLLRRPVITWGSEQIAESMRIDCRDSEILSLCTLSTRTDQ